MQQHQLNGSGFCKSYLKIVSAFDESLNQQAVYLHNYMVMYEVFLLFVQASHDKNWELQLSALDKMVCYFFAHDQLNFVHHTPLYLDTMIELQMKDIDSWNYLEDNFSIHRSGIYCFAP